MMASKSIWRIVNCAAISLLVFCVTHGQVSSETGDGLIETRIKLSDGSSLKVDEAWESEQGVWYRVGGISHLIERARVKKIERGKTPQQVQVAKIVETNANDSETTEGPVWIYLVGGAKVEADSAIESTAGVWYKRGSFTIFIDRSRVDHIEREVENVAELDSPHRKARGWTTGNAKIDSLIRQNGARHGVDPYLIFCVMEQESHFNSRALSPKGARGLMQLMPGTAARFGVSKASDPAQNISGGTRYLKELMRRFNGRIDLVLAGYNAGEGAVMKFGHKVPPYRETRNYVKRISYRYRQARPSAPIKPSGAPVVVAGS
jgi:Zn-finger nucleic acid-binding protein